MGSGKAGWEEGGYERGNGSVKAKKSYAAPNAVTYQDVDIERRKFRDVKDFIVVPSA